MKAEPDPAESRARAQERLDELERVFAATLPACALCGQRVLRLDEWGLCSKESQPHLDHRSRHRRKVAT